MTYESSESEPMQQPAEISPARESHFDSAPTAPPTASVAHLAAAPWNPTPDAATSHLATMLLEAAARFVDLPAAEFDEVIAQTLTTLANHLQMEHVGLSLLAGEHLGVNHRYVAGSNPLPSVDELETPYPWYASQLRQGIPIILPNGAEDVPDVAPAERAYALEQGLKSSLVLPLRIGEQLIGSLYINSTTRTYTWPALDLHALTLFGRVLSSAAQRRQTDEAMRRNEEQLALAIDAAQIGIWSWDIAHPERSYGSDNLSKIHGITPCPKELALQIYMSALHPDDRSQMEQLLARCLSGDAADFMVENRLTWPDGSLHWVEVRGFVQRDEQGRAYRITGVLQEITPRKLVEAQVEQQRLELLRYARMMAQTEQLGEIGGWEWDLAGDAYYWTPESSRIFGLASVDPAGGFPALLERFTSSGASMLRRALQRARDFGESFDLKLQLNSATNQTIWVRLAGRTEAVDGQIVRVYGSLQDITLRTQIEEQLREAQKAEAVGQLAGGIAHDFNNLLTAINGMSELTLRYLDRIAPTTEIDRIRNYVSEIQRAGSRAAALTRQLLAYSRKQVLHPKVLDLRTSVLETQDLLRQLLGDDIELVLVLPPHLAMVLADPSQIEQVISHLVINARDAMPYGGTLTIRLANASFDEATARQHARLLPGDYVVLEVQDSGLGMTPEVQARLFDPFFTTKGVGAGSGMGLATVYGIVKQSGGFIDVHSEPAVGSTFRIFLPQSTPPPSTTKVTSTAIRGGTETIVLAGGDAWARQGYRVTLEAKGYRVLVVASGREAITLCQNFVGPIHLLVISVLDDMSTLALANQARLTRADVRVLLLERGSNGESAPPLHDDYFFLKKPFTPDVLAAKVRVVLDTPASTPLD